MRFFILISLFTVALFSQNVLPLDENMNPKAYSLLGDEIYDNAKNIEKLKQLKEYSQDQDKIDKYISKVNTTKEFGFGVDSGARSNVKFDYLKELREHKKVNDYFLRTTDKNFKSALKTQNNILFITMVNSSLVNTRAYKKQIMTYYKAHSEDINPEGVIQAFIDEDKKRWKPRGKTKKQLHEEKVKRLRENAKRDQEALEKRLADEVKEKKIKIRQAQERELFN